jgi:hypothetical protein
MPTADPNRLLELQLEIDLASLRSHETHMKHIYGLRWGGLALSALTIVIGAAMVFVGLQGSFNWAVEVPNSIGAKLTNASPGIVFATVGMILGFIVIRQQPVNYSTGDHGNHIEIAPRKRGRGLRRRSADIQLGPPD